MRTAMIDTMIFDALSADATGRAAVLEAVRFGHLRLVTTHVQEHQLADIPDPVKRKRLQTIPREVVPSSVAVLAVSRRGHASLGPATETEAVRQGDKHAADAVIADAASARADVLVTDDNRLAADARARGIPVWRTAELIAWAAAQPE